MSDLKRDFEGQGKPWGPLPSRPLDYKDKGAEEEFSRVRLGESIRRRREMAGVSAAGLAARLNVTRNTVGNYEAGRTEPTVSQLVCMAGVLGCGIEDLIGLPRAPSGPDPKPGVVLFPDGLFC